MAIFTTGLLFHPMVLTGIAAAFAAMSKFQVQDIYEFLKLSYFYIGAGIWASVYTVSFAKVYKRGGVEMDSWATFIKAVGNAIRFCAAFVLTISFCLMWSF
ncbi:MAG: hypothetical protein IJ529_00095 [Alphaproteobacteria bacterium]|nr:hypothetical protein [Alphaproteobacteria bacterium]